MKKTLESLSKLLNSAAFLRTSEFPNQEISEKCRHSLVVISELTRKVIAAEDNVSDTYMKMLKSNFVKYMDSETEEIPKFLLNKRSIKQIISHFNDKEFHDSEIYKTKNPVTLEKIFVLLETAATSEELGIDFSICLLKFYYTFFDFCSKEYISSMKAFLDKFYAEKYHLDIRDYLDIFGKNDFREVEYKEFLKNIKINTIFISTNFFQKLWSVWCLTRKKYSKEFIAKNKTRINAEKENVRKCILAVMTCKVQSEEVIKNDLLPMFGSTNPTDKDFWKVTDNELENLYGIYLEKAPKIYLKFFTKTFLEVFFNVLSTGVASYSRQTERAVFWESYIDSISDFKIAVNSYYDKLFLDGLRKAAGDTKYYLKFYQNCKVHIEHSGSAAILMHIKHYLAIEFTEHANAGYIYHKNSDTATKLFKSSFIQDVSVYKKQYTKDCAYRIVHRAGWQQDVRYFLNQS